MHVAMAGLDYKTSGVTTRELFAVPPERLATVLDSILSASGADGCAILSTCNRTELYISHSGETPDCLALLCAALDADIEQNRRHFSTRRERQAVVHLMRVAAGMESSVLGDDQILTQTRAAIEHARKAGTADPVLETLFRCAVTAGKKVKTTVPFQREGCSVAAEAVNRLHHHFAGLAGKKALIIGNGVVGRLAAKELLARRCRVTMTLRRRSPIKSGPPEGCEVVDFDSRVQAAQDCDFVISATSSPHLTLTAGHFAAAANVPEVFVDLAVPRDLDPTLGTLGRTQIWNVDDLRPDGGCDDNQGKIALAEEVIDEEAGRFEMWRRNRWLRLSGQAGNPDFPIFINLHGSTVLIAGGGKVAARRAEVLLDFGAHIRLVAPELSTEAEALAGRQRFEWLRKRYQPDDMEGVTLAVAATDDRKTNRRIGLDAREHGILVSVADRREECSFYFPAVIHGRRLTAGLISTHGEHALARRAAAALRQELDKIDAGHQSGNQTERAGDDAGAPDCGCHTAGQSAY